ncbi:transglutaminase superfamily protein [Saccharothrix australiensis]|uniref:Transglutaminase superfamily protein n=1 Tax=Saccharothrix australiensis TaxID=2072 RepID=A0A495VZT8_9PSEU|nr:transglutaminase superfamily protein [Saccharothrix australiensis]
MGARRRVVGWGVTAAARCLAVLPPRWIRSALVAVSTGARPASYAEAESARGTVIAVSLRCAGPGCLPRSIATALLCRLRGAWPTWRVGVRTSPFGAHAWVEAEGRPVGEPPGTDRLHVLMTVPPRAVPGSRVVPDPSAVYPPVPPDPSAAPPSAPPSPAVPPPAVPPRAASSPSAASDPPGAPEPSRGPVGR